MPAEYSNVSAQMHDQEAFTYEANGSSEPIKLRLSGSDSSLHGDVLLVNIGSGVSLLKIQRGVVNAETMAENMWSIPDTGSIERVSGCSVGGATFLGLSRLLTRAQSFDEAVELASHGDNARVAMLVKDIYGGEYSRLQLPGDVVAADFGKISTVEEVVITDVRGKPVGHLPPPSQEQGRQETREAYPATNVNGNEAQLPRSRSVGGNAVSRSHVVTEADLNRGLLVLVLNNIAQVAFMNAKAHNVKQIFFTGGFLRDGVMMTVLTSALKFWSGGDMQAGFLKHNTYFGAVGAMLEARAQTNAR
jgi:type II pantothenate kinase